MKTTDEIMGKYWFFKPDPRLQNNLMAFGFENGPGWNDLIDELCSKIEKLFNEKYKKQKKNFEVFQVKEKFGTLRFYVSSAPDEIFDLIDEYESLSSRTCEKCGEYGTLHTTNGWYLMTLCEPCFEKIENHKGE